MERIILFSKTKCKVCGEMKEGISSYLGVCRDCIREKWESSKELIFKAHFEARAKMNLPAIPPKDPKGVKCKICAHECQIPEGGVGYCGLSKNIKGKLVRDLGTEKMGLIYVYKDFHPTNCVAQPFCAGGTGSGYPKYSKSKSGPEYGYLNASLFCGTCCYHCLYCQNTSWHRMVKEKKEIMKTEQLVEWLLSEEKFTCMCWFGGSPEPQMPFVYEVSKRVFEEAKKRGRIFRVCLECNGNFSWPWLEKIAQICLESGGGIKFDLKAWNENLNFALCGVSNKKTFENFEKLVFYHKKRKEPPFLRASTLLVPHYIDENEIKKIAQFIASLDKTIPYSLLAFYPCYLFSDMPLTSREFALKCKEIAQKAGLKRVRIGNLHLLC